MTSLAEPLAGTDTATRTPGSRFVGRRYLQLVLVLGALSAIGPLTIDAYLPALPELSADMGATDAQVAGVDIELGLTAEPAKRRVSADTGGSVGGPAPAHRPASPRRPGFRKPCSRSLTCDPSRGTGDPSRR